MKPLTIHITNVKDEYFIALSDIKFLEVEQNYVDFYLVNTVVKNVRMTLTNVMELINQNGGFEVHHLAMVGRKHIINFDKVTAINYKDAEIQLEGCSSPISLSKTAIKDAKDFLVKCNKQSVLCADTLLMQLLLPLDQLNSGAKTYENGVEYVDLGLPSGLKWAACNFKGENPGKWGVDRQWGVRKWTNDIRESSYPHYDVTYGKDGKPRYHFNKSEMKPSMDAVHMTLKGGWHIPSTKDFKELFAHCKVTHCFTFDYDYDIAIKGILFEGKNGNRIFLRISRERPCETFYWTRDVREHDGPWAIRIPDEFTNIELALLGKALGKPFNTKEEDISCYFEISKPHFEMALRPVTMGVEGQ